MTQVFQIPQSIDHNEFVRQISVFLAQRDRLTQLAFDLYDANNDDKITECDLFKLVYSLKGNQIFEPIIL